jgi:WS/DGAT/MGAT family acyltransferase
MHTLKVSVIEPTAAEYSFDRAVEELHQRLHLLPAFRRRIVRVPFDLHHPVWFEDPDFDIRNHVHRIEVPAPHGQRQVDEVIGEIASTPLDRSRPLWELWILEGVEGGLIVGLVKLHHLVADGTAAAHLLANVMGKAAEDIQPAEPPPARSAEELPTSRRLLLDALRDHGRQVAHLPVLLGRTARNSVATMKRRRQMKWLPPMPLLHTPKTSINSALTSRCKFATTSLPLDTIKSIKNAAGVTLNDVLLAAVGASLRRYLEARGDLPDLPLVAEVPISTDPAGGPPRLIGNRVSNIFTSLGTNIADPSERLRVIHAITDAGKELEALMGHETYREWAEYMPPRLMSWVTRQYSRSKLARKFRPPVNVIVSCVRGPAETLYWAGNTLHSLYSVGPLLEGVAVNVTAWSYRDRLYVAALVCPDVIPDPYEITEALHVAVRELAERPEVVSTENN